jgi:hypothetical protein
MHLHYRVKTIVTSTGERLPILLGRDGLPMFEPTVFSLSEQRSRNRASNSIDSYMSRDSGGYWFQMTLWEATSMTSISCGNEVIAKVLNSAD